MNTQLENRIYADAQELERDFPSAVSLEEGIMARLAMTRVEERRSVTLLQELALAGLFVIAVALLAIGIGRLRAINHQAPVRPHVSPSQSAQAGSQCMGYGPLNGPNSPLVKMVSTTTGWALGGLQTTDGGAHWRDTSPSALRDDAPTNLATTLYPPGYADFYLDAAHAWEVRSYASSTSCVDHISVFVTADGGRSWQQSEPIDLKLGAGTDISEPRLFFNDPQHGWALIQAPRPLDFGPPLQSTTSAHLFRTIDGGLHWKVVADLMKAGAGITQVPNCGYVGSGVFSDLAFASESTGWVSIPGCQQSTGPEIFASRNGGISWSVQRLPSKGPCPCWAGLPTFFDAMHGIVQISDSQATPALYATSDGGRTWQALPALPDTGYSLQMSLASANDFWDVVTPPGWTKVTGPPRDWLYRSTNGGRTWQLVGTDLPIGFPVFTLTFVDPKHGFVLEQAGLTSQTELLATSDGGHSWKLVGQVPGP